MSICSLDKSCFITELFLFFAFVLYFILTHTRLFVGWVYLQIASVSLKWNRVFARVRRNGDSLRKLSFSDMLVFFRWNSEGRHGFFFVVYSFIWISTLDGGFRFKKGGQILNLYVHVRANSENSSNLMED